MGLAVVEVIFGGGGRKAVRMWSRYSGAVISGELVAFLSAKGKWAG